MPQELRPSRSGATVIPVRSMSVTPVHLPRAFAVFIALLCILWPNVLLLMVSGDQIGLGGGVTMLCLGLAGASLPLILSRRAIVAWGCNFPCVVAAPIFAAFIFAYKEPPQNGVWVSLLATNLSEATEQVGANWIFVVAGLVSIGLYSACYRYVSQFPGIPFRRRAAIVAAAICVIIFSMGLPVPWTYPDLRYVRPLSTDMFYGTYPTGVAAVAAGSAMHTASQITPAPNVLRVSPRAGRQIFVFVIGETVQYSRWEGVAQDLNSSLLREPDTIVFHNNVSQADFTAWSVPLMLSGDAALSDNNPSWLEFARKSGFATAWLTTSSYEASPKYEARADQVVDFRRQGHHDGEIYDDELLTALDHILSGPEEKLCIVIHMMGGHFSYEDRYRPSDAHYLVDKLSYNNPFAAGYRDAIHASYANAMLKDVRFVEQVEQRLRSQAGATAMMVYAPDHGENLFDDHTGVLTHGREHPSIFELEVPIVIWASERFRQEEAPGWEQLKKHASQPTSNRSIFPTLLWAMGIEGTFSAAPGFQVPSKSSDPERMISFGYELTVPLKQVLAWTPDASIKWKNDIAGQVNDR